MTRHDAGPALALGFHKYEGLGNDFVLVEAERADAISAARARALCDRRRGIGADGVLLVVPANDSGAAGRMIVINADGSIPEMCGNGLRCVALHVARRRGMEAGSLSFETGAGLKNCVIDDHDGRGSVAVDMGAVRWVEDVQLELDGVPWELSLADAGNPHAITRGGVGAVGEVTRALIDVVGPRIATHERFPGGTNVEFAVVRSKTEIDLIVWERGVGVTEACGTGACAVVAVAVAKGWSAPRTDVSVRLPGGTLAVNVREEGKAVIMTGPARHVFSGTLGASS